MSEIPNMCTIAETAKITGLAECFIATILSLYPISYRKYCRLLFYNPCYIHFECPSTAVAVRRFTVIIIFNCKDIDEARRRTSAVRADSYIIYLSPNLTFLTSFGCTARTNSYLI